MKSVPVNNIKYASVLNVGISVWFYYDPKFSTSPKYLPGDCSYFRVPRQADQRQTCSMFRHEDSCYRHSCVLRLPTFE